MELTMTTQIPNEFIGKQGTSYDTEYLYTGFSRINVAKRRVQTIRKLSNGNVSMLDRDYHPEILSRVYHKELVRITEYGCGVWSEVVGDNTYFFAPKQLKQVAST